MFQTIMYKHTSKTVSKTPISDMGSRSEVIEEIRDMDSMPYDTHCP